MNILIAGEGGQGIQTIAESLAYAADLAGLKSSYLPQFGVEQRGTPSVAFIKINQKTVKDLKFKRADLVVILRQRAISAALDYIDPHTTVIFDSSTIDFKKVPKHHKELLGIPATQIAKEKFIPKVFNVIVFGALGKMLDIDQKFLWQALEKYLGKKFISDQHIRELNRSALSEGLGFVFERSKFTKDSLNTSSATVTQSGLGKKTAVYASLCKGCGICILKCPFKAIGFSETIGFFGNPIAEINLEKCTACQICSLYCPDTAISVIKIK